MKTLSTIVQRHMLGILKRHVLKEAERIAQLEGSGSRERQMFYAADFIGKAIVELEKVEEL